MDLALFLRLSDSMQIYVIMHKDRLKARLDILFEADANAAKGPPGPPGSTRPVRPPGYFRKSQIEYRSNMDYVDGVTKAAAEAKECGISYLFIRFMEKIVGDDSITKKLNSGNASIDLADLIDIGKHITSFNQWFNSFKPYAIAANTDIVFSVPVSYRSLVKSTHKCSKCNGNKTINVNGKVVSCNYCRGNGKLSFSDLGVALQKALGSLIKPNDASNGIIGVYKRIDEYVKKSGDIIELLTDDLSKVNLDDFPVSCQCSCRKYTVDDDPEKVRKVDNVFSSTYGALKKDSVIQYHQSTAAPELKSKSVHTCPACSKPFAIRYGDNDQAEYLEHIKSGGVGKDNLGTDLGTGIGITDDKWKWQTAARSFTPFVINNQIVIDQAVLVIMNALKEYVTGFMTDDDKASFSALRDVRAGGAKSAYIGDFNKRISDSEIDTLFKRYGLSDRNKYVAAYVGSRLGDLVFKTIRSFGNGLIDSEKAKAFLGRIGFSISDDELQSAASFRDGANRILGGFVTNEIDLETTKSQLLEIGIELTDEAIEVLDKLQQVNKITSNDKKERLPGLRSNNTKFVNVSISSKADFGDKMSKIVSCINMSHMQQSYKSQLLSKISGFDGPLNIAINALTNACKNIRIDSEYIPFLDDDEIKYYAAHHALMRESGNIVDAVKSKFKLENATNIDYDNSNMMKFKDGKDLPGHFNKSPGNSKDKNYVNVNSGEYADKQGYKNIADKVNSNITAQKSSDDDDQDSEI